MLFIIRCDATSKNIISLTDSSNCESWTEAFKIDLSPHCNSHILMQKGKIQQLRNSIVLVLNNCRCPEEPQQRVPLFHSLNFLNLHKARAINAKSTFNLCWAIGILSQIQKYGSGHHCGSAGHWCRFHDWFMFTSHPVVADCILFEHEFPMRHCDHAIQKSILPPLAGLSWHGFTAANQQKWIERRGSF